MIKNKELLFDLDGTISDPKIGITKSVVRYALQMMNIAEPNSVDLECLIGSPLQDSFKKYYNLDEEKIQSVIEFYRKRFKEKGMFENELYANISSLLKSLKYQKSTLVIATSKPTEFAEEILKYFNIDHYFDFVVGSNLDGTRISKLK